MQCVVVLVIAIYSYTYDVHACRFQAKQWFNVADACYQQLVLHFAYTHLVTESVYLAVRRTLSSSHPVFQLLMPHLNHICIVNACAHLTCSCT